MAKVQFRLIHDAAMTTAAFDRLSTGQAYWWLKGPKTYIRLPRRVRGDEPIDVVVPLEPGSYVLGVGPSHTGVRRSIEVSAEDAPPLPAPSSDRTAALAGKTFVITGDLDAMDRDTATTWLASFGARVTGSVSGKTDFLVVGREPGWSKVGMANELGVARITEADLRAQFGFPEPPEPTAEPDAGVTAAGAPDASAKVRRLMASLSLERPSERVEPIIGPAHFSDLGLVADELWGIAIGPRGGSYFVHVDFNARSNQGVRCSCRDRNPCKHAHALLFTATRHFVPPAPAPEGHRDAARYVPSFE